MPPPADTRRFGRACPATVVAQQHNSIARTAKISTMTVEIIVSRREGHVTFAASALTCWRKVKGFVVFDAICRSAFKGPLRRAFLDDPENREMPPARSEAPASTGKCSSHAFLTRKAGFPSLTRRVSVVPT